MSGNKSTPMTGDRASAIQSANDKAGKDTGANSFASRAQSGAAKNDNAGQGAGKAGSGNASGGQGQKK